MITEPEIDAIDISKRQPDGRFRWTIKLKNGAVLTGTQDTRIEAITQCLCYIEGTKP